MASFFTVAFLPVTFYIPIVFYLAVYKNKDRLRKRWFARRYGSLTEGLQLQRLSTHFWQAFVLLKWMITFIVLVGLKNVPALQITSLYLLSVFR